MKAEESEVLVSKIASSVFKAQSNEQRTEILGKQLLTYAGPDQATLIQTMAARSTVDLSASRMILLIMDVEGLAKSLGPGKLDALRSAARSSVQNSKVDTFLGRCAGLKKEKIDLFRAKLALMMQTVSLVNEKLESKKLPVLKMDAFDLFSQVLTFGEGDEDNLITIDLNIFSKMAWGAVRDVLLEADFEASDEETYQFRLSEEQVKALARMTAFSSMLSAGAMAKLSETMLQRQALMLMKRFCLVVRTATMYPPDHPGLPAAFDSLKHSIDNALADKEMFTLTAMGTDVLFDDLKIRREDKFKSDFCRLLDERQVRSVSFRNILTLDELKTFVYCFTEAPKQLQDKGGVKKVLERKEAHGIVVDQFKYGVIADDGTMTAIVGGQTTAAVGAADKLLDSLIYSQMMDKMQKEGGIQELGVDEVGAFFKDVLSDPTEDKRRALTRLLLTLDPGLFERGILSNPEVRKQLSWAAARKTLEVMLKDLQSEDIEDRERALEAIEQLMDIAITRNKENTIQSTVGTLVEHLAHRESEADLTLRTARVLKNVGVSYIRRNKLEKAHAIIGLLVKLATTESAGRREESAHRAVVPKAARSALRELGVEEDIVDALMDSFAGSEAALSNLGGEILESLDTDMVVNKMFRLFLDPDRAVRNKAYRMMKKLGPRALRNIELQLEILSQKEYQGRDPATGRLKDEDWYIYRNCVDLFAEIVGVDSDKFLMELAEDQDPRVRKECVLRLVRLGRPDAITVLKQALNDPNPDVRETAVTGLGAMGATDSVDGLIEFFYQRKPHREAVVGALERIGTEKCLDFLLPAVSVSRQKGRERSTVFREDPAITVRAIRALGAIGGEQAVAGLQAFVNYWGSSFKRAFFRPVKELAVFNEIYQAAVESLAQARRKRAA